MIILQTTVIGKCDMSNRSMLEFNHDLIPQDTTSAITWADKLLAYLRNSDVKLLPNGVTFFHQRHHSEECPLGDPPHGWNNNR